MKKLKKIMTMGLAAMMAMSVTSIGVFAENKMMVDDSIYAYMDYNSASDEMKELILDSRSSIVYSSDVMWTVDGQVGILNDDGTTTILPEFNEVFPSDWNLDDITAKYEEKLATSTMRAAGFSGMVNVPAQSDNYSSEFYQFTGSGADVYAWAETLPTNYTINFGFRNADTNRDIGWAGNLPVGRACSISTVSGVRYAVRCSSSSGNCNAWVCVQDI